MAPTRPGAPVPVPVPADVDAALHPTAPVGPADTDHLDRPGGTDQLDDRVDGDELEIVGGRPGARSTGPDATVGEPPPFEALTFDDLYREEYDAMVRVAFLLVGTAESAEELVQDAFIKVHLRWSRIDSPRAFLRTCVVNGCRDRIRRRMRLRARMPRLVSDAADRSPSDGGDGGPAAELHDVLLGLPLRQRAAIVGRFYGGWDDATIAAAIGVRPGTVRSLVHRGLAALRTEIPR